MPDYDKPVANPLIVLREEFDDWAILFDPDTGNAFGLQSSGRKFPGTARGCGGDLCVSGNYTGCSMDY